MAVYTPISEAFAEAMASVHPGIAGPPPGQTLKRLEAVPQGSINTTYRVHMNDGRLWYLRINEGKPFSALVCERDLLERLHASGHSIDDVVIPRMERSVAGGAFFAVEHEGTTRWASFFAELPGRDLGVFEVTPAHTAQVGRFLAGAHHRLRRGRRRRNPYAIEVVEAWLHGLLDHPETREQASALQGAMEEVRRRRRLLPRGTIHGDLFIDNTKWTATGSPRLRAVFDWEMAGTDSLMLDLAITVCAWAFVRDGEEMVLDGDIAAAMVEGYRRRRALHPSEARGLFTELRLAAIRFTTSRLRDFSVPREGPAPERRILDPNEFRARLSFFDGLGERATLKLLGL